MHGQTAQGYDAEPVGWTWTIVHFCSIQSLDTPTKPQVSKRPVSKCSVSKRLKRQVYKMSGLQNVRSSKRWIAKKHPYIFCTWGWWKSAGSVAAMFAGKVMAMFYSQF